MKISIESTPKEIADLVLEIQSRQIPIRETDDSYMFVVNDDDKTIVIGPENMNADSIELNEEKMKILCEQLTHQIQLWS